MLGITVGETFSCPKFLYYKKSIEQKTCTQVFEGFRFRGGLSAGIKEAGHVEKSN